MLMYNLAFLFIQAMPLAAAVDGPLGQAAGIINRFGLFGAFAALLMSGFAAMQERHMGSSKIALYATAIMGLAWVIVHSFYTAGGQDVPLNLAN